MSILLFIVFGLVVGLIARAVLPGRQSMGLVGTILLGIAGSFMGGFLVALVTHHRVLDFNTAGIIGSIIGALVLCAIVDFYRTVLPQSLDAGGIDASVGRGIVLVTATAYIALNLLADILYSIVDPRIRLEASR